MKLNNACLKLLTFKKPLIIDTGKKMYTITYNHPNVSIYMNGHNVCTMMVKTNVVTVKDIQNLLIKEIEWCEINELKEIFCIIDIPKEVKEELKKLRGDE